MKRDENSRTPHDHWTKDALALWLGALGDVQLDARIAGASRRGDVLFTEGKPARRRRTALGLLGKLAYGCVLFEPFRNPVTGWEVATCLVKSIEHTAQRMRAARRAKQKLSSVKPTVLCVITPSASAELKAELGLTLVSPDNPGLYRLAKFLHAFVIVVDELPCDASTLWLRLLGRGEVQRQAAEELRKLGATKPLVDATFSLLVAWCQEVPHSIRTNLERDEAMNWQRVYEKWEQKTLKKGRAEGEAKGKAEVLLAILTKRGLALTATQRKQILNCQDCAQLDEWVLNAYDVADVKQLLELPSPRRRRPPRRAA